MGSSDQLGWVLLALAGSVFLAAWSFRKVWKAHASRGVRIGVISTSVIVVAVVVLVGLNLIPPPEDWPDLLQRLRGET